MSTTSRTTTSKSAKGAEVSATALSAACLVLGALAMVSCTQYVETETPPGQVPPPARSGLVDDLAPHGRQTLREIRDAVIGVASPEPAEEIANRGAAPSALRRAPGGVSDGRILVALRGDD